VTTSWPFIKLQPSIDVFT